MNQITVNVFYAPLQGGMIGVIQKDVKAVVSNGTLTATYTARELLGGGLKSIVDSQSEFDKNVADEAILQFKRDCVTAVNGDLIDVLAGRYDGEGERDYKVVASFAEPIDVFRYVAENQLESYPFCVIEHGGKTWDFKDWHPAMPVKA